MDSQSPSELDIHQRVDNSRFLHGRIDPGLEENLDLLEAVEVQLEEKTMEKTMENTLEWDAEDATLVGVEGESSQRMSNIPLAG
jgi:hypothetical protein